MTSGLITLRYNRELVRSGILTFFWRKLGARFFIAWVVMAAILGYFIVGGDRSWFVGSMATILVGLIALLAAVLMVQYRRSMARLRKMEPPHVTLALADDGFTLSSNLGSSTLRWPSITEVWVLPRYWMLFFSPGQYIMLPAGDVPADQLEFIRQHVRVAGGKIA